MFGFIDLTKSTIKEDCAVINFIDAETGKYTEKTLKDPDEIRKIVSKLSEQSSSGRGITTIDDQKISDFEGKIEIYKGKPRLREAGTNKSYSIEYPANLKAEIGKSRYDAVVSGVLRPKSSTIDVYKISYKI